MKKYKVIFEDENGKLIYEERVETCGGKMSAIKMATDIQRLPYSTYYVTTRLLK